MVIFLKWGLIILKAFGARAHGEFGCFVFCLISCLTSPCSCLPLETLPPLNDPEENISSIRIAGGGSSPLFSFYSGLQHLQTKF